MSDHQQTDSVEIVVRPVEVVARRCIILSVVLQRIGLGSSATVAHGDDPAATAYDIREWLRSEDLWRDLTPLELDLLSGPYRSIDLDEFQAFGMPSESFAALSWSLGLTDRLSDGPSTPIEQVIPAIPMPWDKTANWIAEQTLRPDHIIALRREQAEIWEWRLAMEPYRRLLEGSELMDLEKTIRDVLHDGTAQGILAPGRKGGFAIGGRPLAIIDPLELEELHLLAQERLIALNWVCGHGASWDEAPLDIDGLSPESSS